MKEQAIRAMVKTAGGKVSVSGMCQKGEAFRTPYFLFTLTLPGSGQVRERTYAFTWTPPGTGNGPCRVQGETMSAKGAAWAVFASDKLRPALRSALIYGMSERTTPDDLERNASIVQEFEAGKTEAWSKAGSLSVHLTCFANALLLNPIPDPPHGLGPG